MHLDATEHGGGIVFLHSVKEGPANQSYGLQVAALAGVPRGAIKRARDYLQALERQRDTESASPQAELPLAAPASPHPSIEVLADVDPDRLTPREALDLIYLLKDKLD